MKATPLDSGGIELVPETHAEAFLLKPFKDGTANFRIWEDSAWPYQWPRMVIFPKEYDCRKTK